MAVLSVSHFSFQVDVFTVKSSMWTYFYTFLVWASCYTTSVTGEEEVFPDEPRYMHQYNYGYGGYGTPRVHLGIILGLCFGIPVIIYMLINMICCCRKKKCFLLFCCKSKRGITVPDEEANEGIPLRTSNEQHPLPPGVEMKAKPRNHNEVSVQWEKQLKKLANLDDREVTEVGSLVFSTDEEFSIGSGGYADVFLGLRNDGTEVAVKRMTKIKKKETKNEVFFLRHPKLDNPSIVQYVDCVDDKEFVYLALQLCEYDLESYIKKQSPSEVTKKELAHQLIESLDVLHCNKPEIVHRDIKPQNVLIDIEGKARLADFGISIELKNKTSHRSVGGAGTKCWRATETIEESVGIYRTSSDIQVAGMLIYYIISGGNHPFGEGARCETKILDGHYKLDHVQDVVAKELIEWMINKDHEKRPTAKQCLGHPFFLYPKTPPNTR